MQHKSLDSTCFDSFVALMVDPMGSGRRSGGHDSLEKSHSRASGWGAPGTLPLVLAVAVLLRLAVGLHPYSGEVIRDHSKRTQALALRAMLAHACATRSMLAGVHIASRAHLPCKLNKP